MMSAHEEREMASLAWLMIVFFSYTVAEIEWPCQAVFVKHFEWFHGVICEIWYSNPLNLKEDAFMVLTEADDVFK